MFTILDKAFRITMAVGVACLGVLAALVCFKVALGVTVFLLGSGFGTLLFIWIVWMLYKEYRKRHPEDTIL